MNEQYENKLEEMERVEYNEVEARTVTKRAKSLCYPVNDISVELSRLANECGLEHDMESYLEDVRQIQNKLESAFYRCEEVFADKIRSLEDELQDIEDKESEYD